MEISAVFPDAIARAYNQDVKYDLEKLKSKLVWKNDANGLGEFGQSQTNLQNDPDWSPLIEWCKSQAIDFWRSVGWECEDLVCCQAWVNDMSNDSKINWHRHSNSMISVVYYLDVTEDSGGTIFQSTKNPLETMIQTEVHAVTPYTIGEFYMPAIQDTAVIFPSYMNHTSKINTKPTKRFTVSMNFMPTVLGKENHFNWLQL
jgi:hypothetical protein